MEQRFLNDYGLPYHKIHEVTLPQWSIRWNTATHIMSMLAKYNNWRLAKKFCGLNKHPKTIINVNKYKYLHGSHCALYDAFETYLLCLYEHNRNFKSAVDTNINDEIIKANLQVPIFYSNNVFNSISSLEASKQIMNILVKFVNSACRHINFTDYNITTKFKQNREESLPN